MGDVVKVSLAAVGLVFFAALFLGQSKGPSGLTDQQRKEAAAAECWREQGKQSLDANTKQFAASVCEKLDAQARGAAR